MKTISLNYKQVSFPFFSFWLPVTERTFLLLGESKAIKDTRPPSENLPLTHTGQVVLHENTFLQTVSVTLFLRRNNTATVALYKAGCDRSLRVREMKNHLKEFDYHTFGNLEAMQKNVFVLILNPCGILTYKCSNLCFSTVLTPLFYFIFFTKNIVPFKLKSSSF